MDHRRYRATAAIVTLRAQGRNVSWLARQLGVSRQYTSDVLHGRCVVRHEIAERIARVLDVPLCLVFDPVERLEEVV